MFILLLTRIISKGENMEFAHLSLCFPAKRMVNVHPHALSSNLVKNLHFLGCLRYFLQEVRSDGFEAVFPDVVVMIFLKSQYIGVFWTVRHG